MAITEYICQSCVSPVGVMPECLCSLKETNSNPKKYFFTCASVNESTSDQYVFLLCSAVTMVSSVPRNELQNIPLGTNASAICCHTSSNDSLGQKNRLASATTNEAGGYLNVLKHALYKCTLLSPANLFQHREIDSSSMPKPWTISPAERRKAMSLPAPHPQSMATLKSSSRLTAFLRSSRISRSAVASSY